MEAKANAISLDHDLVARFDRVKAVASEQLKEAVERYEAAVEIANIRGERQSEWIRIAKERRDRLEEMLDGKGRPLPTNRISKKRHSE